MNDERFATVMRCKHEGQYDEALNLLAVLLAEHPNEAELWHQKGLIYGYQVEIDESLAALERACALVPYSRIYLTDLGKTFAMYGMRDNAKRIFERLLY